MCSAHKWGTRTVVTPTLRTVVPLSDLAEQRVLDPAGREVRLGGEWESRPAVVVWLRHFGCLLCREQAADFRARLPEIEALGARLVLVGNGEPAQAREFEAERCPGCRVLTDPGLRSYRTIGARRGWRFVLGPAALRAGVRAFRRGFRQARVRGIADQLGGVFVLLPGNRVAYSHLSGSAGDHPPADTVIAALRSAATPEPA